MSGLTITELQPILQEALSHQNLENLSLELFGSTDKGDGYTGEAKFALIKGSTSKGTVQHFNVVLKCSRRSKALREKLPIRELHLNEIYVYEKVFPVLNKFALEKGPHLTLDCVPRCLGTYAKDQTMEILIFENLRELGYELWNRRFPVTLEHLRIVLPQYGKLHALSAALRDQHPEQFKDLAKGLNYLWPKLSKAQNLETMFSRYIEESYQMLKDALDETTLTTWLSLKSQIQEIFVDNTMRTDRFTVITHGDGWINNLLFQNTQGDPQKPIKPMLLDWQVAFVGNPVCDISFFIHTSISPHDLTESFDTLVKLYHDSFSKYVREFGSDPNKLYPYEQFLEDWKVFGKFGVLTSAMIYKLALVEDDNAPDLTESLERGQGFEDAFSVKVNASEALKLRFKTLVEHAVGRKFI